MKLTKVFDDWIVIDDGTDCIAIHREQVVELINDLQEVMLENFDPTNVPWISERVFNVHAKGLREELEEKTILIGHYVEEVTDLKSELREMR